MLAVGRRDEDPLQQSDIVNLAADMRAMGASEAAIEAALAPAAAAAGEDALVVYGRNGEAVRLFMAMNSQWRTTSLSSSSKAVIRRTGLDYGVLDGTAALAGLQTPITPDTFRRLQVMEAAATTAWRKQEASAK